MTSSELYVGFRTLPVDLDQFLHEQGYRFLPGLSDIIIKAYEHEDLETPELLYRPVEDHDFPRWGESGIRVIASLEIGFKTNDINAIEEAERLAEATTKKYDGVYYDSELEEFFTKGDLD